MGRMVTEVLGEEDGEAAAHVTVTTPMEGARLGRIWIRTRLKGTPMPNYLGNEEYERSSSLIRERLTRELGVYGYDEGEVEGYPTAIGYIADIPSVHIEATDLRDYAIDIAQSLEYFRDTDPRFGLALEGEELVAALEDDLLPAIQDAVRNAVVRVAEQSTERYGRRPTLDASPRRPRLGR